MQGVMGGTQTAGQGVDSGGKAASTKSAGTRPWRTACRSSFPVARNCAHSRPVHPRNRQGAANRHLPIVTARRDLHTRRERPREELILPRHSRNGSPPSPRETVRDAKWARKSSIMSFYAVGSFQPSGPMVLIGSGPPTMGLPCTFSRRAMLGCLRSPMALGDSRNGDTGRLGDRAPKQAHRSPPA